MNRLKFTILIPIITLLTSCGPDDIEVPAWEAEFLFPIVESKFNIEDVVLSDSLYLREDSIGALTLVYISSKDSVRLFELLDIPNQSFDFELDGIPNTLPDFQFSEGINIDQLGLSSGNISVPPANFPSLSIPIDISEVFEEAEFESGFLNLAITNGFPFNIKSGANFEVTNSSDNSTVANLLTTSDIAPGETYQIPTPSDLAAKIIEGHLSIVISDLATDGASNVTLNDSDELAFTFEITQIALKKATLIVAPFEYTLPNQSFQFDIPNEALLTNVNTSQGHIAINAEYDNPLPISINYTFPHTSSPSGNLSGSSIFNGQSTTTLDLTDVSFDLTSGGLFMENSMVLDVIISSNGSATPVTIDFGKTVNTMISIQDFKLQSVFGYLGFYQNLLEGFAKIDFFDRVSGGSISFNNPKVIVNIDNELGVSVGFIDNPNLYVRGRNNRLYPGVEVDIYESLKNVVIGGATIPGDIVNSQIILGGENEPSFGEFISLLPQNVDYSFPLFIGTEVVDYNQFAIDTSQVKGNIQIEFPLDLQSNNLTITDTLDFNIEFDSEYAEFIEGVLSNKVENYFPLEFLLQAYFMDSTYQRLDSVFLEKRLISPGELNEFGRVENPFRVEFNINVGKEKLENIKRARFIQPEFVLNTTSQERVKIFNDTYLIYKLNGDFQVYLPNEL